ncbi:MAG: CoA transferase [Rhodospirillaceae bacterium]|nr:CoA transferase [Rhodospirillaceae bacterium]MDD9918587.1 CoA transferase [Rhodospirillaceae bacterium]MDD9924579.1 CoA transferase [Rhodospirillaceae bacterium]
MLPLDGVRVLSVEQYGAGPWGTQYLADLGAEVIKIENPNDGGDMGRSVGPYFIDDGSSTSSSLFFQSINRNKRSLTLDLGQPEGQAILHELVKSADAITCNLRGDVPAKLGLTYETLGAINPRIVCAFLSAYGREGPRQRWPGYDYLMQAEAGYFGVTGEPDGNPTRMGLSIVDLMTGLCMAYAAVSAILSARATGKGRDIDVNLFDLALSNVSYPATWYLNTGHNQGREPRSGHPSLTPCAQYKTKDGWIFIMCNKEKFWPALCDAIGQPRWGTDPRYATFKDRLAHRTEIQDLLDEALSAKTTEEWLEEFAGIVPAAPILDVGQAMENPFVTENGKIQTLRHQNGTEFRVLDAPFDTGEPTPARPGPELGEDTDSVLQALGYDDAAIATLRNKKII